MTRHYFLFTLLSIQLIAAPLEDNHPSLIADRAKALYIKKAYLKSAEQKAKQIKKKIRLLKNKKSLSPKTEKQIVSLSLQLKKILFWQEYHQLTESIVKQIQKNDREDRNTLGKLREKRDLLTQSYQESFSEPFPRKFDRNVYAVRQRLKAKAKKTQ